MCAWVKGAESDFKYSSCYDYELLSTVEPASLPTRALPPTSSLSGRATFCDNIIGLGIMPIMGLTDVAAPPSIDAIIAGMPAITAAAGFM